MADEKLNTGPGEEKLPEAPAPVTVDEPQAPAPEQTAAPTPQQEGPAQPEPGDVVVSFDKINELMNEKRQTARAEVEKEEAAKEPKEKTQEEPPTAGDDEPKKARRGRPPKEEKAEPAGKEAAKPRKGRPPKADKAAPGEATPTKRDKLSRSGKKTAEVKAAPEPEKAPPENAAPAPEQAPPEPAAPPRPVEEGKLVYLKLSEMHPFHTFRPHPFKVRDDAKMQETVASIIVDPMGEYAPLVRRLGGQVIEIAPDSPHHLNPMDVELNMAAGESPLSMKADFLLSLCELVVGGKEGLQPIEKTVVDRCVRLVYREQALGLDTGKTPLLQDLYEELLKQPEPEARRVATALELYCTGSLNLFNHPTNVKTDSRVVCIVLKNMGENLRKIAMHITNEFVSQAVDTNFREGVATWCYFDEFHVLLRDPLTASYFVAVWKMLRKKGCVPSALTQNVKDLLASREIENILDNTDFMILLSQAQSDRAILARQLGISEHQLSYITHSNSGEGLLFYGNVTIPFVDRFPKGEIYDLLTTRPEDMKNEAKTE